MEAGKRSVPPIEEFELYENEWKFYFVGTDKSRKMWRVLNIDRTSPGELVIKELPDIETEAQWQGYKDKLEGRSAELGPLKYITQCYGVVGFFKFLGPYYMMLITKRIYIGTILGHRIYTVSKTEIYNLKDTDDVSEAEEEKRYKDLLCNVHLTKGDFFFSYSYNIMNSLQMNLSDDQSGEAIYESMFVWNAHLMHVIPNNLRTTSWTVALVHGFFKQIQVSINSKTLITLISRRSRHFAGPRYLKRGLSSKGKVANDVETEQIVFEDTIPTRITSVVQRRGSIPLFWSQNFSGVKAQHDIILPKQDEDWTATKLHFEDLAQRYGNPIVLLSLIREQGKKADESVLHAKYIDAINHINKDLPREDELKFLHLDVHKESKRENAKVMESLEKEAKNAFKLTGFFNCQVPPALRNLKAPNFQIHREGHSGKWFYTSQQSSEHYADYLDRAPDLQTGILRTNCLDSLDRTNAAQYAFGLVALRHQLNALGINGQHDEWASYLKGIYIQMGDKLSFQYAGSPAHDLISSYEGGQSVATKFAKLRIGITRLLNSFFIALPKQDALDIFLGHFQPQRSKTALWMLESKKRENIRRDPSAYAEEAKRTSMKRSYSEIKLKSVANNYDVSGSDTASSSHGGAMPGRHLISLFLPNSVYYLSNPQPTDTVSESRNGRTISSETADGIPQNNSDDQSESRKPITWQNLITWITNICMQCLNFCGCGQGI